MNMNRKRSGKMMRGFMCQSPAATAVCMTGDDRSVIVPRRPDHRAANSSLMINNGKYYSRLQVDHHHRHHQHARRFGSAPNKLVRSTTLPPINKADGDQDTHHTHQKPTLQKPSSVTTATDNQVFQVVVMRVSLHCQGCAGKVKKHISKMEGVTSFSIDLESKRVTVMGHVSPDGVLESISKVKRAEFWTS